MTSNGRLTPTEQKILNLLGDCKPHAKWEIHNLLWDEKSDLDCVKKHVSNLRKKLKAAYGDDQEIISQWHKRQFKYRLIIRIATTSPSKV